MDIMDFTLKMEKNGEVFYRKLAVDTNNTSLKNIFIGFANDEAKHYKKILDMDTARKSLIMHSGNVDILNVFENMSPPPSEKLNTQLSAYTFAMENERKSMELYMKLYENTKDEYEKTAFISIYNEEQKHYEEIEKILSFLEKGRDWVESAEFNITDDY